MEPGKVLSWLAVEIEAQDNTSLSPQEHWEIRLTIPTTTRLAVAASLFQISPLLFLMRAEIFALFFLTPSALLRYLEIEGDRVQQVSRDCYYCSCSLSSLNRHVGIPMIIWIEMGTLSPRNWNLLVRLLFTCSRKPWAAKVMAFHAGFESSANFKPPSFQCHDWRYYDLMWIERVAFFTVKMAPVIQASSLSDSSRLGTENLARRSSRRWMLAILPMLTLLALRKAQSVPIPYSTDVRWSDPAWIAMNRSPKISGVVLMLFMNICSQQYTSRALG